MTNISCIPLYEPIVIVIDDQVQICQDASEASDKFKKPSSIAVAVPKIAPSRTNFKSSTQRTFTVAAASVIPLTNSDTVVGTSDIDLESGERSNANERQIKLIFWVFIITFLLLSAIGVMVVFVLSVP